MLSNSPKNVFKTLRGFLPELRETNCKIFSLRRRPSNEKFEQMKNEEVTDALLCGSGSGRGYLAFSPAVLLKK